MSNCEFELVALEAEGFGAELLMSKPDLLACNRLDDMKDVSDPASGVVELGIRFKPF